MAQEMTKIVTVTILNQKFSNVKVFILFSK